MRVILEVIDGAAAGKRVELEAGRPIIIGRSHRADFCIGNDSKCSRMHLQAFFDPPLVRILDLGSTSGTHVGGQQVHEAAVPDGSEIRIGHTVLRVVLDPVGAPAVVPEEPAAGLPDTDFAPAVEAENLPDAAESSTAAEGNAPAACFRCAAREAGDVLDTAERWTGALAVCPTCLQEMRQNGEHLPGFRFLRPLSEGSTGTVWLAQEILADRPVAVKEIAQDRTQTSRFRKLFIRGMELARTLRHPHIVRCHLATEYQQQLYIVMEYLQGQSAEQALAAEQDGLPIDDVLTIGEQVLQAIAYAHDAKIVHRDITPANVMLCGSGPDLCAKVIDFGLARLFPSVSKSEITRFGEIRGSIPYLSPEQVINSRGADQRADIYGVGVTLYRLLTDRFAYDFESNPADPLVVILQYPVIPVEQRRPDLPAGLAAVIDRAIQRNPGDRYQTAAETAAALREVAALYRQEATA